MRDFCCPLYFTFQVVKSSHSSNQKSKNTLPRSLQPPPRASLPLMLRFKRVYRFPTAIVLVLTCISNPDLFSFHNHWALPILQINRH
ncbi:hypothetical protein N431DRAFT_228786 [Stipitochalara longipes BDJ]|nr:hypothetical protein N431DRAFT_228786 [Stipitochalara longipes BDJ]